MSRWHRRHHVVGILGNFILHGSRKDCGCKGGVGMVAGRDPLWWWHLFRCDRRVGPCRRSVDLVKPPGLLPGTCAWRILRPEGHCSNLATPQPCQYHGIGKRASWNDLKFRWMVRAPMSIASRFTGLRQLPLAMSQIAYKCVRSIRGDRACAQYGASSCHPGILDHLDYGPNSLVLPPQHSCPSDNEGSQQTWQSKPHYL